MRQHQQVMDFRAPRVFDGRMARQPDRVVIIALLEGLAGAKRELLAHVPPPSSRRRQADFLGRRPVFSAAGAA